MYSNINNTGMNLVFANFVRLLHILLLLFVLIAPFTDSPGYLVLHITLSFSLITHWLTNSDICSLSLLESKLRGKEYDETFIHQIVSPVYKISDSSLSKISYIAVITLMMVSIYKLYMSGIFGDIKKEIQSIRESKSKEKGVLYLHAISKLFQVV